MTMNALPGNPHYGSADGIVDAVVFSADGSPMQTTEILLCDLRDATLALAFEQRTANLIAWHAQLDHSGLDYQATDLYGEIEARLGMNGDTK